MTLKLTCGVEKSIGKTNFLLCLTDIFIDISSNKFRSPYSTKLSSFINGLGMVKHFFSSFQVVGTWIRVMLDYIYLYMYTLYSKMRELWRYVTSCINHEEHLSFKYLRERFF